MSRNLSVTLPAAKLAAPPIAAIRAAAEADAYFSAKPLPAQTALPDMTGLELMYAYYTN